MSTGSGIFMKSMGISSAMITIKSQAAFDMGMKKGALTWLQWVNNGGPSEPATPPIKWGVLRASASVFVGKELVDVAPQEVEQGAEETPDPARSYNGKDEVITIVYNSVYAFKMHEQRGKTWQNLGEASARSQNATDKWLEKHIASDGKDLFEFIAKVIESELGKASI